jgi:hypothetical protein
LENFGNVWKCLESFGNVWKFNEIIRCDQMKNNLALIGSSRKNWLVQKPKFEFKSLISDCISPFDWPGHHPVLGCKKTPAFAEV